VPIDGHVSGLGKTKHREFAFAAGEMSREAFTAFLKTTLGHAAAACRDGAIAFVCMDWRHLGELLAAGEEVFSELKNVCVWNKSNGGMGSFYRSKHELIFAFKVGTAPHTNTFGLGDGGRYRTNVWDYAGVNTMKKGRMDELSLHPTVKPVALVADAILDVTKRGALVLDPFGGSGTTLIAAEKTGRTARLIEFDPLYCDVIIRRFEAYTGKRAMLDGTGEAFEDVADARCPKAA
jgi:DNA modification methylase